MYKILKSMGNYEDIFSAIYADLRHASSMAQTLRVILQLYANIKRLRENCVLLLIDCTLNGSMLDTIHDNQLTIETNKLLDLVENLHEYLLHMRKTLFPIHPGNILHVSNSYILIRPRYYAKKHNCARQRHGQIVCGKHYHYAMFPTFVVKPSNKIDNDTRNSN